MDVDVVAQVSAGFHGRLYPAEVLVREGIERHNVVFLAKPFTRDDLLRKWKRRAPSPGTTGSTRAYAS